MKQILRQLRNSYDRVFQCVTTKLSMSFVLDQILKLYQVQDEHSTPSSITHYVLFHTPPSTYQVSYFFIHVTKEMKDKRKVKRFVEILSNPLNVTRIKAKHNKDCSISPSTFHRHFLISVCQSLFYRNLL
jgi:hypothetical protein